MSTDAPGFLSGMTYAYLNPRSPRFPKGNYCDNIIGVVRGTTADKDGLRELTGKNMLMRFNKAVDLELSKQTEKDQLADKEMRQIIDALIPATYVELRPSYSERDIQDQGVQSLQCENEPLHSYEGGLRSVFCRQGFLLHGLS